MSTLGRADEDDDDGDDDDGDSIDDDGDDGGEVNGAHRVPQPNVRLDGGQSRSSGRAKHLQHIDYFNALQWINQTVPSAHKSCFTVTERTNNCNKKC